MNKTQTSRSISIPLNCVRRVTLSPWTPATLVDSVKATIKNIKDGSGLEVYQSTLLENERWKKVAIKAGQ